MILQQAGTTTVICIFSNASGVQFGIRSSAGPVTLPDDVR